MTDKVYAFAEHRSLLTDALIVAAANYCHLHGLTFNQAALSQMSLSIEDCAAEVLMFGANRWPSDPTDPMADGN